MNKEKQNGEGRGDEQLKCFYRLSDGADVCEVVVTAKDVYNWLEGDEDRGQAGHDKREYTITPIWMTETEFRNLPEADI
jgi:hypothetical protein